MASKATKMSTRVTDQMRTAAKKLTRLDLHFGFFTRTLRLTLCAIVLLTVLPCGQGAPATEPDSLVYQENLARSK